jgi:hypothetical protein
MKNLELPSPADLSAAARAGEITTILAAAIVRSLVSGTPKQREVGLVFSPGQSVHATSYPQERAQ